MLNCEFPYNLNGKPNPEERFCTVSNHPIVNCSEVVYRCYRKPSLILLNNMKTKCSRKLSLCWFLKTGRGLLVPVITKFETWVFSTCLRSLSIVGRMLGHLSWKTGWFLSFNITERVFQSEIIKNKWICNTWQIFKLFFLTYFFK